MTKHLARHEHHAIKAYLRVLIERSTFNPRNKNYSPEERQAHAKILLDQTKAAFDFLSLDDAAWSHFVKRAMTTINGHSKTDLFASENGQSQQLGFFTLN